MREVVHVDHGAMRCDQRELPHVDVEQQGGVFSFRVGRWEWRGADEDAVMAAADEFLQQRRYEHE